MIEVDMTVIIERLSHDGRGIALVDGKTVFVDNALPGEKVDIAVRRRKKKLLEAVAETIIKPSPNRISPPCPAAGHCGGCRLQHISNTHQINHKQSVLDNHLKHMAKVSPKKWLPPLTGPVLHYRRRARLSVKWVSKKNCVLVGFHEKQSHFVTDITHCPVLTEKMSQLIMPIRELFAQLSAPKTIVQCEIAHADNALAIVLRHTSDFTENDILLLSAFAQNHELYFYSQTGGPKTLVPLYPKNPETLYFNLTPWNIQLQFTPLSFIQINATINLKMVRLAIELLNLHHDEYVLDLFSGLGNFALPIATQVKKVVGVEGEASLVAGAIENARHNRLTNTEFFTQNLSEPFNHQRWAKEYYDIIILDPPRTGAKNAIAFILEKKPKKVLYIACDPATLARDTGLIVASGQYTLSQAGIMDMFPHTQHVESIALFTLND